MGRFNSKIPEQYVIPFFLSVGMIVLAVTYLAMTQSILPTEYASKLAKHNPNYTIFYLLVMPIITGLTIYSGNKIVPFGRVTLWARILFIAFMALVPVLSLQDAMNKGTPIPISHLKFQSEKNRNLAIDSEAAIRRQIWTRDSDMQISSENAKQRYKSALSTIMGTPDSTIQAFSSQSDFFTRCSKIALADLALSTIGAGMALYFFLILMYSLLARKHIDERGKHLFVMIFWLWTLWFPSRSYSLWYQNFYSTDSFGIALIVAGILAVYALLLTGLSVKQKPVKGALTLVFMVVSFVAPILAKFNSRYVIFFGEWIDNLPIAVFLIIELLTLATLGTFVWVYFSQNANPILLPIRDIAKARPKVNQPGTLR
jgi:hypothetical protein